VSIRPTLLHKGETADGPHKIRARSAWGLSALRFGSDKKKKKKKKAYACSTVIVVNEREEANARVSSAYMYYLALQCYSPQILVSEKTV
jgi:hypothetical protein